MCVLKKDDISIDWSSWSVVGSIALSKLWLEYGLSSNQIRTNDIRNVVLLVVVSSSIHHYILWVRPMLSLVHIIMEVHLHWNFDKLLLSPSATFLSSPWLVLNIKLVLGTCVSIFFVLPHEGYVWMEEVTSSDSRAFGASCRREFEKVSFASYGIIPSQSCTCEESCGLKTCNLQSICIPSTPSHWLICSRRRSSF